MKTHFAMPWYGLSVCGMSLSYLHSADPAQVTCVYCRRYNLSERAKAKQADILRGRNR